MAPRRPGVGGHRGTGRLALALVALVLVAACGNGGGGSVEAQTLAHWDANPDQVPEACYVFVGTFAHRPGQDPESAGGDLEIERRYLDENLAAMSADDRQGYTERFQAEAGSRGIPPEAEDWSWEDVSTFLYLTYDECMARFGDDGG